MIKLQSGDLVPCSRCPLCIQRRIQGWAHRLMQQEKIATHSQFLTLTYATEKLPFNDSGASTAKREDVQNFVKRLRQANNRAGETKSLKYYCAAEYGGITGRPHYHMLLFNSRIDLAQPAWDNGNIHYGIIEPASIYYTFKYLTKSEHFDRTAWKTRARPFALSSKGLGATYLTPAIKEWHKNDLIERVYVNDYERKMHMPRYYRDKIYDYKEKLIIGANFQKKADQELEKFMSMPDFEKLYYEKKQGIKAAYNQMYYKSTKMEKL